MRMSNEVRCIAEDNVLRLNGGRSADVETKKLLSDSTRVRCEWESRMYRYWFGSEGCIRWDPCSTICIFVITNHQLLFSACITSRVKSNQIKSKKNLYSVVYFKDSEALGRRIKWCRRNDTDKFLSVFETKYSVSVNNIDRQTVPQRRCSNAERSLG